MSKPEIEDLVLELLANTASSFAALYGDVFRGMTVPPSVDEVLRVLTEFEHRGWIRMHRLTSDGRFRSVTELDRVRATTQYRRWLDGATASELVADKLSLDEVGLWIEIQLDGRRECARRVHTRVYESALGPRSGQSSAHCHDTRRGSVER